MFGDDPSKLTLDPKWGRKMLERRGCWALVETTNRVPTQSYAILYAMRLDISDASTFGWYQKPNRLGEYCYATKRTARERFLTLALPDQVARNGLSKGEVAAMEANDRQALRVLNKLAKQGVVRQTMHGTVMYVLGAA